MTPHTCPVCNGQGKVQRPPFVAGDQETYTATDTAMYACPACQATGIVWEGPK